MPHMISSWSVADGVSPSVSKSKQVYRSLIFVDNNKHVNIKTISNSFCPYAQVILLIWRVLHL